MVKFVYFDFGAVLVNYDDVFEKVCKDFNLNRGKFREFYSGFIDDMDVGKINVGDFWGNCIKKFKIKNADNYNLAKSWVSDYQIIKPVQDLIYSVEGKIKIGIISNIPAEIWWAAMGDNWVPNIKYDEMILSSDVEEVKPERKIYEIAQKRLKNINPTEIMFIDDKPENLIEPNAMGWKTFCFDQLKANENILEIQKLMGLE